VTEERARPLAEHAAPLAVLVAASLGVFWEAVFTSRVFFRRDVLGYWYPLVETFVRVVGKGSWPLWDPYETFGLPMLADPGSQVLYPTTWLNLLFLPHTVYKVMVVGHAAATGVALYFLARRWGMGAVGACAAGLSWMLSGPFVSFAGLYHHYCGAAWIPFVMLALEAALGQPTTSRVLLLAMVAAGQVFAGSGDMLAMSALCVAARVGLFLVEWPGNRKDALRRLGRLSFALPLTAALAAVQLLPTLDHLRSTSRSAMTPASNLFWSLHPAALVDVVVPRLVGDLPYRTWLFEGREPFLESVYLGAVLLIPAAFAVLAGPRRARFAALMALVFVLLALGRYTPLLEALVRVPPFRLFRYPVKYMAPAAMWWSLLAGFGVHALATAGPLGRRASRGTLAVCALGAMLAGAMAFWLWREPYAFVQLTITGTGPYPEGNFKALPRVAWTAGALTAAAALFLARHAGWGTAPRLAAALALVAAVDLAGAAQGLNPLGPRELVQHRPPILTALGDREGYRVLAPVPSGTWINEQVARGPAGWTKEASYSLGVQDMLYAPCAGRWAVRGSYDADFTGLGDPALPAMSLLVKQASRTSSVVRLLQIGNVGSVIEVEDGAFAAVPEVARFASVFASPIRLLQVPDPLPRAYLVSGARFVPSNKAAFDQMMDPGFDPRREAAVAGYEPARPATAQSAGSVRVLDWRADRIALATFAHAPAFLVLVQSHDPGWRATVGGRSVPVRRTNVLYQSVEVPSGQSQVELVYRPRAALLGSALSAAAWLGALAVLARRALLRGPSGR
jgi:hypothetical protein